MNWKNALASASCGLGLALSSVGCASIGTAVEAPLTAGEARMFEGGMAQVVGAARSAIDEADLVLEQDRQVAIDTWMIVADKPMSLFSYGEIVRITFEDQGEGRVLVRLHVERRFAANVTAKDDWTKEVFGGIATHLRGARPA